MSDVLQMAEIRALIGDAAHANMLLAPATDGRCRPGNSPMPYGSARRRQAATGAAGRGRAAVRGEPGAASYYRLASARVGALLEAGHVRLAEDGAGVTPQGLDFFSAFALDLPQTRRRPFCRTCIDWSERRLHLSGELGAALCRRCLALGWIERQRDSRAVQVTEAGATGLRSVFGVTLDAPAEDGMLRLA